MMKCTVNLQWKKTLQTSRNNGYPLRCARSLTQLLSSNKLVTCLMCLVCCMLLSSYSYSCLRIHIIWRIINQNIIVNCLVCVTDGYVKRKPIRTVKNYTKATTDSIHLILLNADTSQFAKFLEMQKFILFDVFMETVQIILHSRTSVPNPHLLVLSG